MSEFVLTKLFTINIIMNEKINQFIGEYIAKKQNELSSTLIDIECLKEMHENISNTHR